MSLIQKLNIAREFCRMFEIAGNNYSSKINKSSINSDFKILSISYKGNVDDIKTEYQFTTAKICYVYYISVFESCIYQLMNKALVYSQATLKEHNKKYVGYPNSLLTTTKSDLYPFSKVKDICAKMGKNYLDKIDEIISVRNYIAHGEKEKNDLKKKYDINIINDLDEIHTITSDVIEYIENM